MATLTRRLTSLAIMQTRRFSQRSERSESPLTELESEDQQQPQSPLRKRRRKTKPEVVEPVVYDIPPVQSRTTTYRGLVSVSTFFVLPAEHCSPLSQGVLVMCVPSASVAALAPGFELNLMRKACLNTILRSSKPDPIFCSRCVTVQFEVSPLAYYLPNTPPEPAE